MSQLVHHAADSDFEDAAESADVSDSGLEASTRLGVQTISRQIEGLFALDRDPESSHFSVPHHGVVGASDALALTQLTQSALRGTIVTETPTSWPALFRPTINLQEWEGRVTGISEDTFNASLVDISAGDDHELEQVELPLSDLSEDDLKLLQLGAVFRWVIGYRKNGATKERFSRVVFRRLPGWTKQSIERIKATAAEQAHAVVWD